MCELTQRSVLPIPYPYCLVVRARQNPGQLVVEENRANIVQMAIEGEEAPPTLVRPDFDLVVIPPRYEQRLSLVEIDTPDWPIMLLESVYQRAHTIVP